MLAALVYVEPRGRVRRVVRHRGGPHREAGHHQPGLALAHRHALAAAGLAHAVPARASSSSSEGALAPAGLTRLSWLALLARW